MLIRCSVALFLCAAVVFAADPAFLIARCAWPHARLPGKRGSILLLTLTALIRSFLPASLLAEDALSTLLERRRSEPSNADLCQQIGIAYTRLENFAEAEKFYREAVRLNPRFWAAHKNLGTVLWFMDRKEESEREFLAVTKVLPADPVPHLYLGLAAYTRRDFPQAKTQFAEAGALASENPEVLAAVLESYLASHDLSFPGKVLERLSRAEDRDATTVARVGALFSQYGHQDRAATLLDSFASTHKASAEVFRALAEAYDRQGKPEQAYRAYSRAAETDPNSEDGYLALADFASAHGNYDYGLQVVASGLEHLPQSPVLHFEQGILWALKGDRSQAENSFVQANRLKPGWNLPLLALGVSRLESGDAAQAVAMFQKVRTADPGDARAQYLYATALSRESGAKTVETRVAAIAALRKAIEIDPRDSRSHTLLGQLYLQAGKADTAAQEWQAALKNDPENSTALYQLGLLYRKQGKTAEAKRLLQEFQRVRAKVRAGEESLVQILRVTSGDRP
jgi:tetratricopeptide (TPR) repeat protein